MDIHSALGLGAAGVRHVAARWFARRATPLVGGIALTDRCNLSCAQCGVANRGLPDLTYEQADAALARLREMGIRVLYLEGGEPTLWRDGDWRLEDIVRLARQRGFAGIAIYTNGTRPLDSEADALYVSLDGPREINDRIRGPTYDLVLRHIRASAHPRIVVNFTICPQNAGSIEAFCTAMQAEPHVAGIFFYFVTPMDGNAGLVLKPEERVPILRRLIALKRSGAPILNSVAAMRRVMADDWERPSGLCYLYADGTMYRCCRSEGDATACTSCGYLSYAELVAVSQLSPGALVDGLTAIGGVHRRRSMRGGRR